MILEPVSAKIIPAILQDVGNEIVSINVAPGNEFFAADHRISLRCLIMRNHCNLNM